MSNYGLSIVELEGDDFLTDEDTARYGLDIVHGQYRVIMHGLSGEVGDRFAFKPVDDLKLEHVVAINDGFNKEDTITDTLTSDSILKRVSFVGENREESQLRLSEIVRRIHAQDKYRGTFLVGKRVNCGGLSGDSDWRFNGKLYVVRNAERLFDGATIAAARAYWVTGN